MSEHEKRMKKLKELEEKVDEKLRDIKDTNDLNEKLKNINEIFKATDLFHNNPFRKKSIKIPKNKKESD